MTPLTTSFEASADTEISTGILLIAHAPLASAFKASAVHAFPEHERSIATYDVMPYATPDYGLRPCTQLAYELYGSQLLILTDIVGASPYNLSKNLLNALTARVDFHKPVELISGTNLPMLLRALTYSNKPLSQLVHLAVAGGIKGIAHIAHPV